MCNWDFHGVRSHWCGFHFTFSNIFLFCSVIFLFRCWFVASFRLHCTLQNDGRFRGVLSSPPFIRVPMQLGIFPHRCKKKQQKWNKQNTLKMLHFNEFHFYFEKKMATKKIAAPLNGFSVYTHTEERKWYCSCWCHLSKWHITPNELAAKNGKSESRFMCMLNKWQWMKRIIPHWDKFFFFVSQHFSW